MRISLWQQFSSNHSANFVLVGTFKTVVEAHSGAEKLREILTAIAAYYASLPDRDARWEAHKAAEAGTLTPPEALYKEQYGIEWGKFNGKQVGLDWIFGEGKPTKRSLARYENFVFLSPDGNTWLGSAPFDAIMQKLGANTASYVEDQMSLYMTVRCTAPDEKTAEAVVAGVRKPPSGDAVIFPDMFYMEGDVIRNDKDLIFDKLGLRTTMMVPKQPEKEFIGAFEQFLRILTYIQRFNCIDIQITFEEKPMEV